MIFREDTIRQAEEVSMSATGQEYGYSGPLAGATFDLYAAAPVLDDLFRQSKTQTEPA